MAKPPEFLLIDIAWSVFEMKMISAKGSFTRTTHCGFSMEFNFGANEFDSLLIIQYLQYFQLLFLL